MKKKMLVVALMLIVMMTQISAFASSYATYAVHNEKAVLKAADNLGEYAVIPKELEGVTVEGIGADAFKNNKELKGIEIPETVSYIEWGAFEGCDNLTDINIKAFENCKNLKTVVLPKSVEYIAVGAFDGCEKINVTCVKGTYAEEYLKANKISYIVH